MKVLSYVLLTSVLTVQAVQAAETERDPRIGLLTARQKTHIVASPANGARPQLAVTKGTQLRWIEGQAKLGYLRAIGNKGPIGWVRAADVTITKRPPTLSSLTESPKHACAPSASDADCSAGGCALAGTPSAALNEAKRKAPEGGPATLLEFKDLWSLQNQADQLVGEHTALTAEDRATLKDLQVSAGILHEGSLVRVAGFIAQGLDPHPNTGESVNCNLTDSPNNDFHIPLGATSGTTDFQGIVVEMVPQDRPAAWTVDQLVQMKNEGKKIMVEGNLFYDNFHLVNADAANPIKGQPHRRSLWEVHRITRYWVCDQPGGCDAGSPEQWTEVR